MVGEAFHRALGKLLADTELRQVRSWVARGETFERIAAALDAVVAAPSVDPKSRWACAMALVRDTPPDAPMVWTDRTRGAPGAPVVNQPFRDMARAGGLDVDHEPAPLEKP